MPGKLIAALLAALSLSLAVHAALLGWAALAAGLPERTMSRWAQAGAVAGTSDWQRVWRHLDRALSVWPPSADRSADLGRYYAWAAWSQPAWGRSAVAYRRFSAGAYLHSLALRPSWGFVWALLGEARAGLGDVDGAVRAMRRAQLLSPWEPGAQRKMILTGFALWDRLDPPERGMVLGTVRRALAVRYDLDGLDRLVRQFGREAEVDALRADSDGVQ